MGAARLAIETAFPTISAALAAGGAVLLPRVDLGPRRGAALHPAVADLLAQAGLGPADVGEILVDVGPGSYTGLRVGLALVKCFADLVPAEVRTVYSTDQVARLGRGRIGPGEEVVVCLDARRAQWFCARYGLAADGSLVRLAPPRCLGPDELAAAAAGATRILTARDRPPLDLPCVELGFPRADGLFELAHLATVDPDPEPVYLMPPV